MPEKRGRFFQSTRTKEKSMQDLEIYDCHIHLMPGHPDGPETFRSKAKEAGISGGIIFSMPPETTLVCGEHPMPWKDRIAHVLDFCSKLENYYPFYRIDPTQANAIEQVEYAKNAGIKGFKVLCNRYMPADGLNTYRKMAELDMPLLFHSGVTPITGHHPYRSGIGKVVEIDDIAIDSVFAQVSGKIGKGWVFQWFGAMLRLAFNQQFTFWSVHHKVHLGAIEGTVKQQVITCPAVSPKFEHHFVFKNRPFVSAKLQFIKTVIHHITQSEVVEVHFLHLRDSFSFIDGHRLYHSNDIHVL